MLKKSLLSGTASLALTSFFGAGSLPAVADNTLTDFFPSNGFYADVRYRYEEVDQDGISRDAEASTIRTKFGYKTGVAHGFQALIEGENVSRVGSNNFNDTVNGKGAYPVVADPDGTELNQLWVSYAGIADTLIKVGRQGINLDNQRFVGTVGWRQNDQTYDAIQITNSSIDNLNLTLIQIDQVNRIFGEDSNKPADNNDGKLDTDTTLLNASYKVSDSLIVSAYGYWLDQDDMTNAALSSKTYGLRLTGSTPLNDDWKLIYEAEAAEQHDYADNPASYDATYYHLAPAISGNGWTLGIGFESLEGDGSNAFQTPLATLHKFNGWADKFLSTPADGLEDLYVKVAYVVKGQDNLLDGTKIVAMYHEFDAENSSANYGDEWDLEISHPLNVANVGWVKGASIAVKYADYNADDFATDTQKLWLTAQAAF